MAEERPVPGGGVAPTRGRAPGAQRESRWSLKVARLFGIDVYVHVTLLILIVLIAGAHLRGGPWAAVEGVGLVVAVFTVILLHELGHALTARRFGIATRNIILLPIGGISRLERMPEKPSQELLVALAGPAVNVVIGVLCLGAIVISGGALAMPDLEQAGGAFVPKLALINFSLAAFNLLPAFPMDGGRVLRALLAFRMSRARATDIAARLGQAMAIFFAVAGFLWSPILILIAAFVWIAARQEAAAAQIGATLAGVTVGNAMITDFKTLGPSDPVSRASDLVIAGTQQNFPIVENGGVVGVLGVLDIVKALAEQGRDAVIGTVMRDNFASAAPEDLLEPALRRIEGNDLQAVMVTSAGRLVGMLTHENIREFVMFRGAAMQRAQAAASAPLG